MGSETILVVDDEPGVQELVRIILSRQGYRILLADSGPKAIEIYGQTDTAIDLLVTDVVMPGMSGIVLVQRLQALNQELPVLYMTGGTLGSLADFECGPKCALLRKPFDSQSLLHSVRHVLDARRGSETCRCRDTGSQPQP